MGMGVVGILSGVMKCGQPRHAVFGQLADKNPNQGFPFFGGKFQRQRDHDFVDYSRILPVGLLGFIKPSAGLRGPHWHVLTDDHTGSGTASDISRMRTRRSGAVRAASNSAMAQAENRHA